MPLYKGSQEITVVDMTAYYTILETNNKFVEKITNMGLSKNDFNDVAKGKLDFEGSTGGITSLNNMAITKHWTHVSASTNQSFSIASVAVSDKAFVVVFTATAALTIAMPSTSTPSTPTDYINKGEDSYTLAAGDVILLHAFKSSIDNKYYINAEE